MSMILQAEGFRVLGIEEDGIPSIHICLDPSHICLDPRIRIVLTPEGAAMLAKHVFHALSRNRATLPTCFAALAELRLDLKRNNGEEPS